MFFVLVLDSVIWWELVDTNAYKLQHSLSERMIVDGHGCHTALHFGVKAKENQNKVPTLYWLPKLHKKPYKARFIANSSSCTTKELILDKLKARDFNATSLSTYDFSTLYTNLPHNLIKVKPRLWCLTVSLSLSHWYPGSGVVLDCIDS